jgi:hypothetical protein
VSRTKHRGRTPKTCKNQKRKPYGTKGTDPYCRPHDQCMVYVASKKSERAKARKKIREER